MALTRREFFATAGLGAGTLALGNPTATAQPVALGHSTTVTEHDPIMNHIGRELSALQRRGMQSAAEHARVLGSQARLAAIRIRRLGLDNAVRTETKRRIARDGRPETMYGLVDAARLQEMERLLKQDFGAELSAAQIEQNLSALSYGQRDRLLTEFETRGVSQLFDAGARAADAVAARPGLALQLIQGGGFDPTP